MRRETIVSLRRLATPKVRDFFLEPLKSEFNEKHAGVDYPKLRPDRDRRRHARYGEDGT